MAFEVKEIIDYNKIKIAPAWVWGENSGDVVTFVETGTESLSEEVRKKVVAYLREILLSKTVELRNPTRISNSELVCEIFYDEKDLAGLVKAQIDT